MTKKLLALLMIVGLAGALTTGCQPKDDTSTSPEVDPVVHKAPKTTAPDLTSKPPLATSATAPPTVGAPSKHINDTTK